MRSSLTLTLIREWKCEDHRNDEPNEPNVLPVFFCGECADVFVFAVVASASSDKSFENLRPVCALRDQKARFCPMCGSKNKAGAPQ